MRKWLLGGIAAAVLIAALPAGSGRAQTTAQFPTSPWNAFAPAVVQCGSLLGANMNSTADQAIPIAQPGYRYVVEAIRVSNPSTSLTTAAGGVYTGASKTGLTLVAAGQAYSTLTTATVDTAGSALALTLGTDATTSYLDKTTIYLALTTAQGATATADVRVYCRPLY